MTRDTCYTGPEPKLEAGAGRATRAHKNSKLTENPFLSGLVSHILSAQIMIMKRLMKQSHVS